MIPFATRALAAAALLSAVPAGAATFAMSSDGTTLYLSGEITPADAGRLDSVLRSARPGIVELDARGGSVPSGVALGTRVRAAGMKALVRNGKRCEAACTLVWLSSERRYLDDRASVGFPLPVEPRGGSRKADAGDGAARYLRSLGYGPALAALAGADAAHLLDNANAASLGVAVSDPGTLYDADFRPNRPPPGTPPVSVLTFGGPAIPRLVRVEAGRALLEVDEGLEVWAKPGSRLPGGIVVDEVGRGGVKVSWSGGSRRISPGT